MDGLDPLTLFELEFLSPKLRRRLRGGVRLGPDVDLERDRRLAAARVEELRRRRMGAFGLSDTRLSSGGLPLISTPQLWGR